MAEELALKVRQQKTNAKLATLFLVLSMLDMALWGWTPLKNIIPAFFVLNLFVILVLLSVIFTLVNLYRGMQVRALQAKVEDQ